MLILFSYFGLSGILGSVDMENIVMPVLGACKLLHFPLVVMKRRNKRDLLFSYIVGSLDF